MNPLLLLAAAGAAGYAVTRATKNPEVVPSGPAGPAPTGPSAQAGPPVSALVLKPAPTPAKPAPAAKPIAKVTVLPVPNKQGSTTNVAFPTLRSGSSGPDVTKLQNALNANGARPVLTVDGKFGPATLAAVRAYQGSRGLTVDGIVGPATWAMLVSGRPANVPVVTPVAMPVSGPPMVSPATMTPSGGAEMVQAGPGPTLRQGAKGAVVQYLQHLLNLHGAAIKEDGVFGPGTAATVKSYQSGHGLAADGVVGPKTWTSLQG